MAGRSINRRQFLTGALGGAAAVALGAAGERALAEVRGSGLELVREARSVKAAGADLGAVEHVVFLVLENRSFDNLFGTLGTVNGFGASSPTFTQSWTTPVATSPTLLPFHLDVATQMAECTFDLSHTWPAEHASWNNGAMDQFANVHTSSAYEGTLGTLTMGYYEQQDIPFFFSLAESFTICDNYFASVLGPTHPNRLMQMTGMLDPAGAAGGPILVTNSDPSLEFTCSWTTMPEVLSNSNVSWKVYNPFGSAYRPGSSLSMELAENVLIYFRQFSDPTSTLYQNAFGHYGPKVKGGLTDKGGTNDFARDVKTGQLPAVSWIMPPDGFDTHPPAPVQLGEWYAFEIVKTLMSNKKVWANTVLFITFDENDGFFDHVPPPVSTSMSDTGEWITAPLPPAAGGVAGPIGLGVRVPMIVVSPFSVGGWVNSDTFDHTSQLRFLETRFGTTVPNLSAWRRAHTGDLTAALPTVSAPITKKPKLPKVSNNTKKPPISTECTGGQLIELNPTTAPYPLPNPQQLPTQGSQVLRRTPT